MNTLPRSAISPLTIAEKLAAAANLTEPALAEQIRKEPRLVELLWFLQWASTQPGGLEKFALDVVQEFAPHFGPAIVHDEAAPLTLEQRGQIWKTVSGRVEVELIPFKSWQTQRHDDDWQSVDMLESFGRYPAPRDPTEQKRFQAALVKVPRPQFRDAFLDAAKDGLAFHLRDMCQGITERDFYGRPDPKTTVQIISHAPWYCENLMAVLFEAMDMHAARIELQLARTEVVSLVFDRLDYAWQQKVLVKIEGDTRTGKTEAVKAWCAMHPGKSRLVSTPSGKSCGDMFKAIAEAIGLPFGPRTKGPDLKDQIQFIIRHGGLFLVFDEAHFLLPSNFDRNTQPARLDWLRTQVVDRKLPVALVTTPQAFKHSADKFQRWTGYNFGQFFGRIMSNVTLPNELSEADLLAVTKIQGPDIPEKLHRLIVARSMQSEGYLKTIEAVCSRARYIAQRDNHPAITLADVELAASEIIPAAPAPARPALAAPAPSRSRPVAVKRGRAAAPPPPTAPALESPARSITPVLQTA